MLSKKPSLFFINFSANTIFRILPPVKSESMPEYELSLRYKLMSTE